MKKFFGLVFFCLIFFPCVNAHYSQEFKDAYLRAYSNGIIRENSIELANLDRVVSRAEFAEMLVPFAKNIINISIPTTYTCGFHDIEGLREGLDKVALQVCTMGLMGQGSTWFRPNRNLTRAELGTVLSRLFWGERFGNNTPYYINHLGALKSVGIIKKIDDPYMIELKGYVILMFMRTANLISNGTVESNSGVPNSSVSGAVTTSTSSSSSSGTSISTDNSVLEGLGESITNCGIGIIDSVDVEECGRCLGLKYYTKDSFKYWAENNNNVFLDCNNDGDCLVNVFSYVVGSNDDKRVFNSLIFDGASKGINSSVDDWLNGTFSTQEINLIKKCEEQRFASFTNNN